MPMNTEALRALLNQQPNVSADLARLGQSRSVQGQPGASLPQPTLPSTAAPTMQGGPDLAASVAMQRSREAQARNPQASLQNVPSAVSDGRTNDNSALLRLLRPASQSRPQAQRQTLRLPQNGASMAQANGRPATRTPGMNAQAPQAPAQPQAPRGLINRNLGGL